MIATLRALIVVLSLTPTIVQAQRTYDVVIANGRVLDPESGLDATRFVGISNGKIEAVSPTPITGKTTIDAKGLVVRASSISTRTGRTTRTIASSRSTA